MIGNIPQKLVYICRPRTSITTKWDDHYKPISQIDASPTFVSDADNKNTIQTGKRWAGSKYKIIEKTNGPLSNVKIVSFEQRNEGGHAWKVLIDDQYYVDLRSDVLLELLLNAGVLEQGKLNGSFIWGKVGSQMKLIRVNSELYSVLMEANEIDKLERIKELEIGGVYLSKDDTKFVYLGKVSTTTFIDTRKKDRRYYPYPDIIISNIKIEEKRNLLCFIQWPSYYKTLNELLEHAYYIQLQKSHSFKRKVDKVEVPPEWAEIVKLATVNDITKRRTNIHNSHLHDLIYYSTVLNINQVHPLCQEVINQTKNYVKNCIP